MKGVILRLAPDAQIIDMAHEIAPGHIVQASFVVYEAVRWFPSETVHVVVVDPGVGSGRRILAGRYDSQIVVAPDNGIFSLLHRHCNVEALHVVGNSTFFNQPVSPTFHGRDIIAPVAARLAKGAKLGDVGEPTDTVEILQMATPLLIDSTELRGAVLYADRFGNLITNIESSHLAQLRFSARQDVWIGDIHVGPLQRTYGDVAEGELLALVGSSGYVEVSANRGRADNRVANWQNAIVIIKCKRT